MRGINPHRVLSTLLVLVLCTQSRDNAAANQNVEDSGSRRLYWHTRLEQALAQQLILEVLKILKVLNVLKVLEIWKVLDILTI